jgi:hypothetical protein
MTAKTAAAARPRPTKPVDGGLAVICAGFGRTGTSSMQEALELLGYGPCYHMREVFKDPTGPQKWAEIGKQLDAEAEEDAGDAGVVGAPSTSTSTSTNWDDVFFGYQSTTDLPGALFYQQLLVQYPHAKIILTVRDPESWWKSVSETIAPAPPVWRWIYRLANLHPSAAFHQLTEYCIWKPFCGGSHNARTKEIMIQAFVAHNEKVQATVPADKLLIMHVKEGWGPLCQFLGCKEPTGVAFPKSWDSEEFKNMVASKRKKAVKRLVAGMVVVLAGAALAANKVFRKQAK